MVTNVSDRPMSMADSFSSISHCLNGLEVPSSVEKMFSVLDIVVPDLLLLGFVTNRKFENARRWVRPDRALGNQLRPALPSIV